MLPSYDEWRDQVLASNPGLPESYMKAFYEHSLDPCEPTVAARWHAEHLKLEDLKKRNMQYADTIPELLECLFLNIRDKVTRSAVPAKTKMQ